MVECECLWPSCLTAWYVWPVFQLPSLEEALTVHVVHTVIRMKPLKNKGKKVFGMNLKVRYCFLFTPNALQTSQFTHPLYMCLIL